MGLSSSIFAFWQSARIVPLIDYTYQAENAYRIYLGQTPYKDFILSLTPGTYMVMALVMKLFGLSNMAQVFYTMLVSFFTVILSYYVLNKLNNNSVLNLFITAPLIFCGQSIYPFPSYDINAMLFMLLGLGFLLHTMQSVRGSINYFFAGFLLALPFLFKQNTGLVFNLITLAMLFIASIFSTGKMPFRNFLRVAMGSILVYLLFLLWLFSAHAFNDFINQVFIYPGETRNLFRMLHRFLYSFFNPKTLLFINFWLASMCILSFTKFSPKHTTGVLIFAVLTSMLAIPILKIIVAGYYGVEVSSATANLVSYCFSIWHLAILIGSFLFFKSLFTRQPERFSFYTLFPAIPLLVAVASFISQGVDGSSYGIWPLMAIFITLIAKELNKYNQEIHWNKVFASLAIALLITLFIYCQTNTRLKFVSYDGAIQKSTYPGLEHLATRGPWIAEMEAMFRFIDKHIPKNELIVSIPGEDPVCLATGRKPALSFFQLNPITFYPFNGEHVLAECLKNKVKWVIVKKHLQMPGGFIEHSKLEQGVKANYKVYNSITGYDIYIKENF